MSPTHADRFASTTRFDPSKKKSGEQEKIAKMPTMRISQAKHSITYLQRGDIRSDIITLIVFSHSEDAAEKRLLLQGQARA